MIHQQVLTHDGVDCTCGWGIELLPEPDPVNRERAFQCHQTWLDVDDV